MQTSAFNQTTFSPQVQAILPILENLSINERLSVIGFLANPQKDNVALSKKDEPSIAQKRFNRFPNAITQDNEQVSLSREEIAQKRLGFFQGQMTMSDDFDDYLGDDFWFPEDDILYK